MKRRRAFMQRVLRNTAVQSAGKWSKKNTFPGFRGLPIYYVARSFIYGLTSENPIDRAAAMTFKFFMGIFPGILFLCTLIPLIPIEGFQDKLLHSYEEIIPPQVNELLHHTVDQVVNQTNTGLMSVSFLVAFFFSTNGIVGMIKAMNSSANISENVTKIRLKAIGILMFIMSITAASIVLIIYVGKLISRIIEKYGINTNPQTWIYSLRLALLYAIILLIISMIYYLAPAKKFRVGFISPGAFVACNLSIASSVILATFFSNFDRYNTLYGTIGSIPIFLIWIFINCLVLLAGFELNASIAVGKLAKQAQNDNRIKATNLP